MTVTGGGEGGGQQAKLFENMKKAARIILHAHEVPFRMNILGAIIHLLHRVMCSVF